MKTLLPSWSSMRSRRGRDRREDAVDSSSSVLDARFSAEDVAGCLLLMDKGEGLLYRDNFDNTVLHTAAMKRSPLCGALIQVGLNPNARNEFRESPLHIAVTGKYRPKLDDASCARLAELQLQNPALIAIRNEVLLTGLKGNCAIHQLLVGGSDPNSKVVDGKTPLIIAVRYQAPLSMVALLMKHGADPRLKDMSRKDAMEWAYYVGSDQTGHYLKWVMVTLIMLGVHSSGKRKQSRLAILPIELIRMIGAFSRPRDYVLVSSPRDL